MADRLPLAELSIQNKQPTPPTETPQPIKTKKNCLLLLPKLPDPCSLDDFPSPRDKWSAMTHPLWATIMGFKGMPILYAHFYFHNGCVLLTHAYAMSTSATTIGDGGNPQGSTELDDKSGHNYCMHDEDHSVFAHLVLGLNYRGMGMGSKGHKQCNHSFVNAKDTSNATIPLSTCSLPTFPPSPTSTWQFTMRSQMIDKPSPAHLPAVPFSFLVQMPSPCQSSNKCGELMTPSNKNLADHAETPPSSDDVLCHSPRLSSTHTTYGQPRTSKTSASSTITLSAAILKASETSSNSSRIPPLPNMFMSPWHRAPHPSTSCLQTYTTVCPGTWISYSTATLPQILQASRTRYSRHFESLLLYTLHNNSQIHIDTPMFAPVCFVLHLPTALPMLTWQWLLQIYSAGHWEWRITSPMIVKSWFALS